ncbi:MAG: hypothetical protein ISP60_00305 [Flavobacteriaceae bacterium]|nr:hypothetical protein [Flavobacteriaceae bacterium]
MKKGLLGLLVIALTVVGCQNYDDQFDDLNKKIASLSADVSNLAGISASVTALSDKVTQLQNSSASASDLAEVMAEVSGLQSAIDALNYGTAEVDNLEAEVDEIKANINELLAQASIIQQDIVITSAAQLEYVENLMGLDAADDNTFVAEQSREYIVSGNITVDAEFVETAAMGTRLNDVLARIASVITPDDGTGVTLDSGSAAASGSALTMTSMAFVEGQVTLRGANAIDTDALAALTATLTLEQGGAIAFPALNQVGNVIIAATETITSLDFSTVSTGEVISTNAAGTQLHNNVIAGAVNLGKLDLPPSVQLDAATSITAGGAPNGVTISAAAATAVNLIDTTPFEVTGAISITSGGDITLNALSITTTLTLDSGGAIAINELTSVGSGTSLIASTTIHVLKLAANTGGITAEGTEFHAHALATNSAALTVTANTVMFNDLATNTASFTINTAVALNLAKLTSNTVIIDGPAVKTFSAEKLSATGTSTINVADGADITLLNLTATNTLADFAGLSVLTLLGQEDTLDFSTAVSMTTLEFTGKKKSPITQGGQTNDLTITGANVSLENLTIAGVVRTATLTGTTLESFSTAAGSTIINVELVNNASLETISLAHDRLDGENALSIVVTNNDKVQTLDMSSVNKVKTISLTGNGSLTTVTLPGYDPYVEPTANVSMTISGNNLTGRFNSATAGTDTTPYLPASIESAFLCSAIDFLEYYIDAASTGTVTFDIDLDAVDLYTQEQNAEGNLVQTDAESSTLLSDLLTANAAVMTAGGQTATGSIDAAGEFALADCD